MKQSGAPQDMIRMATTFLKSQQLSTYQQAAMVLLLGELTELKAWRSACVQEQLTKIKREALLEDFFAALVIIQHETSDHLDGVLISQAVTRLLLHERAPGGPYETNARVMLTANVMIYQFLRGINAVPEPLNLYLQAHTREGRDVLAQTLYEHATKPADQDRLYESAAITELMRTQNHDGSWGKGSRKVVTTILTVYKLVVQQLEQEPAHKLRPRFSDFRTMVYRGVQNELQFMPPVLQGLAANVVADIQNRDETSEIALICNFYADSFSIKADTVTNNQQILYGIANVFLWMAYTIYDDFIDDEGVNALLPLANSAQRRCLSIYRKVLNNDKLYDSVVLEAFESMDAANSWELAHCRFKISENQIYIDAIPQYGIGAVLAQRAKGHVIGPLLCMHAASLDYQQKLKVTEGLNRYLIARQLNDDIHDWKHDLLAGHCTFVVAHMLRACAIRPGVYSLPTLLAELEAYFWQSGFTELNKIILSRCKSSRHFLHAAGMNTQSSFSQLIARVENSVKKSEQLYTRQKQFLDVYSNT